LIALVVYCCNAQCKIDWPIQFAARRELIVADEVADGANGDQKKPEATRTVTHARGEDTKRNFKHA
jgi:hypothetical protein